jgi:hypothetical protein
MRPDVAPFGALMFPTVLLARHCARPRTPIRNAFRAGFCRFSLEPRAAFLPRSGVLSRHDTKCSGQIPGIIAAVGPPHEAGVIGVDLRGLAPVGAVRGNPCGQLRPRVQFHA